MNAIIVCVDYAAELAITLPYNRHHFERVLVVTEERDKATRDTAASWHADVCCTDAFRANGARFNKFAAMEEALTECDYRHGWLCIMDADVLWPRAAPLELRVGCLYTPRRRMCPDVRLVPESEWRRYPLHRNDAEHAGYSQVFHCDDPVLGAPPWHDVTWSHAGGADSFFQRKWREHNKVRPPWECLHLGEAGTNWCGRGEEDRAELRRLLRERRLHGDFSAEKLKP